MKRSLAFAVFLAVPLLGVSSVSAQTQLSEEDCLKKSPKCTCADGPFMEVYLKNQKAARAAWQTVYDSIGTPYGPANTTAAVAAFQLQLGNGDARVNAQYKTCPSGATGSLTQIAGVLPSGEPWFDQCACEAFCQDIVESTIKHEKAHKPTIILGVFAFANSKIQCAVGVLPTTFCDQIDPTILAVSELLSYSVGIDSLQSAVDDLAETPDASQPKGLCTWKTIAAITPPTDTAVPKSLWARLVNLADRFVHGVAG